MGARTIRTVKGIVDWRLCLGCGACASICPHDKIDLVDVLDQGIRPVVRNESCAACRACLDVCPAFENDHRALLVRSGLIEEVKSAYGPVLELWEGHASDEDIRHLGSSGGLLTALSLHCLEHEGMGGVMHVGDDPADPLCNRTRISRSREELLAATGSRYSPASVCDSLGQLDVEPEPIVFIGQPSEVTALRKAQRLRPAWNERVGLALSFFCAGSPSTKGTQVLLSSLGVPLDDVSELRYRGHGWPGWFGVRRKSTGSFQPLQTYAQSWGFLQAFRPFSVNLTPDGSGEDADISCGDPWYRTLSDDEPGSSLILVRTERGRDALRRAAKRGSITLRPIDVPKALVSQASLIGKRGAIWGRIVALRLLGLPVPRLHGFDLFANWMRLPFVEKAQSLLGTVRRVFQRGWYRPQRIDRSPSVALPRRTAEEVVGIRSAAERA